MRRIRGTNRHRAGVAFVTPVVARVFEKKVGFFMASNQPYR
jgi:hypothetical protein